MKQPSRWIGLGIVASLTAPFGILVGNAVNVSFVVTSAVQENSPVRILGFRMPAKIDDPPSIVVRNQTSREIRDFSFTTFLGNPKEVGGTVPNPEVNIPPRGGRERLKRPVGSGASAEFPEKDLKRMDVGLWAHLWKSNCLHGAMYVVRAEFADGTVWKSDETGEDFETVKAEFIREWRDSILSASTTGCDYSLATQEALGHLAGTGWLPSARQSPAPTDVIPFLAYSCQIRDDVAWCRL